MRRWPLFALVGWTAFVWLGRVRNGGSLLLAASFLVLAALALWRRGHWITALAGWTVAVWVVRTPMILADHQSGAFKAVHTVLAVVSIGLAITAQVHVQRQREAPAPAARL
ncbi:MAG TPA: hypothetical protein VGZ52_07590 [Acidimicrobiales bacterium]|jgi:hypothetical protein|nr:hypothetical protein [Acidimicrobiales bacterium]